MKSTRLVLGIVAVAGAGLALALAMRSRTARADEAPVILVAPFRSDSVADGRWSALGLQRDVDAALRRQPGLRVISLPEDKTAALIAERDSVSYRQRLLRLGREAEAAYVLEAVMRRREQQSEILTELLRVADGRRRWVSTYWLTSREAESFAPDIARAIRDVVAPDSAGRRASR